MMITALYAALLALLFIVVSARVSQARGKTNVSLGDGGNEFLIRRIRVHGNFAEYIPFALLLLLLAEMAGLPSLYVHFAGGTLLLGRLVMIYGMERGSLAGRVVAMLCTYIPFVSLAIFLLYNYLTTGV